MTNRGEYMFTGLQARNGELYLSSLEIARVTGKRHDHVLRDIRVEKEKFQSCIPNLAEEDKVFAEDILKGFSEEAYTDPTGRLLPMFQLSERAATVMLLRYSLKFRLHFMRMFEEYRPVLLKYLQEEDVTTFQKPRYVYIIENVDTGNFKAGTTTDVERRLTELQTGCDGELSVYYESLVYSSNIEAKIHKHFRAYRLREGAGREWFSNELDKLEVIDYIEAQEEEHEIL